MLIKRVRSSGCHVTCLLIWNIYGILGFFQNSYQFTVNKNLITESSGDEAAKEATSGQRVRLRGVDRKVGAGRLEIFSDNKWHIICDKYFTSKDADVACKSLGFHNGVKIIWRGSAFGNGFIQQFWPYELNCNGTELDLFSCQQASKEIHCDSITETLGIECRKNYESYCDPGEVAFGALCYRVVKEVQANFEEAHQYCQQNSGSLAIIKNQNEMDHISEMLFSELNNDHYSNINLWYIGAYKTDDSNAWAWASKASMEGTHFTKWKPDYWQKPGRNCLALIRNQSNLANRDYYFWDSVRCTEQLNFVCQRKLDITKGCLDQKHKRKFDGTVHVTVDGLQCAKWNDPGIWRRRLLFRGQTMMNHNYCRNPDNDRLPWCVIDYKTVGYCDAPSCSNIMFPKCDKNEVQCANQEYCVPAEFLCDFDKDCPNGFDEENCPDCGKTSRRTSRSAVTEDLEPVPWGKVARIVGGFETSPGSYPWMASIRNRASNSHYCGASVIDKYHVITAAHCFEKDKNSANYLVVIGEWDVTEDDPNEVKFEIEEIIPHPDYKSLQDDDIAIVRLKTNSGISFTDYIQPVCLATKYTAVSGNTKCYVSGWGSNGERAASRMQAAHIPIIPRSVCTKPDVYGSTLSPRTFCAGYLSGGIDTCIGDSGGPFACESNGRYFLFGMVSWGEGCAEKNKPGVYTSINEYTGWIRQKTMKSQKTSVSA